MAIGKAYAYLDYEGRHTELISSMNVIRRKCNFPNDLEFTILDDREKLPKKIANTAEATDVYRSAFGLDFNTADLLKSPKRAADLGYTIMSQAPEVRDSESAKPLGQGRANEETAGMLNQVLSIIGEEECSAGRSEFLRAAVFYVDNKGRVQRYV